MWKLNRADSPPARNAALSTIMAMSSHARNDPDSAGRNATEAAADAARGASQGRSGAIDFAFQQEDSEPAHRPVGRLPKDPARPVVLLEIVESRFEVIHAESLGTVLNHGPADP